MKLRKWLVLLLALALSCTTGCRNSGKKDVKETTATAETQTGKATEDQTSPVSEKSTDAAEAVQTEEGRTEDSIADVKKTDGTINQRDY